MTAVYDAARRPVRLGPALARGGEGIVYLLPGQPDQLAKLYLGPAPGEAKLAWMTTHPPLDPAAALGHVSIAWPRDLLYDGGGACVGFRMPRIRQAVPLFDVFNPRRRAAVVPGFSWRYLHRTARNLAAAVGALHARDYVIGDVNESNVLVTPRALVALIDTDSFQVRALQGARSTVFPCPVGKPEYTPPELQGQPFRHLIRLPEHDHFALGVLVFQLLMEGNHPFRARWRGSGEPPSLEAKISAGYFPHQRPPPGPVGPPPHTPALEILHPSVAFLVRRCFVDGHRNPKQRPGPADWERALAEAERTLVVCPNGDVYSGHLRACPWCGARPGQPPAGPPVRRPERPPIERRPVPTVRPPTSLLRPRPVLPSIAGAPAVPSPTAPVSPRRRPRWTMVCLGVALLVFVATAGLAPFAGGLPSLGDPVTVPLIGRVALPAGADADVASGCWTAEQRVPVADAGGGTSAPSRRWRSPPAMTIDPSRRYTAVLRTGEGTVQIRLLPGEAPRTVNNFVCLARAGFFDGTPFHRVTPGFVVQGGDPTGTGAGGPGYQFADEPVDQVYRRGTVAMANLGPDSNGSQFFVLLDDPNQRMAPRFTIFGQVIGGQEVLDAIAAAGAGNEAAGSLPVRPAVIERVVIREAYGAASDSRRSSRPGSRRPSRPAPLPRPLRGRGEPSGDRGCRTGKAWVRGTGG